MAARVDKSLLQTPLLLNSDNFTPLTRTPWAGCEIAKRYKSKLLGIPAGTKIGESWEFSCDPAFPSRLRDSAGKITLHELMELFPKEVLGKAALKRGIHGCDILVKLLNADQELSLQVHPWGNENTLAKNECGKPEAWLVLHAEAGAGIYMGFSRKISKDELRVALTGGEDIRSWLNFVPVKAGDYFEIKPGVPHAIAPGTVLLEPQQVVLGKEGKTYRLWDWNRTYEGKSRTLHVEEGLSLVDPEMQVGEDFVKTLRKSPRVFSPVKGVNGLLFPKNDYCQVLKLEMQSGAEWELKLSMGFAVVLLLEGELIYKGGKIQVGETALIPNAALPLALAAQGRCQCIVIWPAYADAF